MAQSDFDSKLDEMERDNLQRTISEVERARATARLDARPFFETFLLNARGRVSQLDKKIKDSQEARESQAREQAAVAALAQKESALSARERETYSGFLKEDFFTKKDFGRLEEFYGSAWDRLSESGKAQMSHRIWEGIRHHEYTFDQLPPKVREKEMERAYGALVKQPDRSAGISKIPEQDRSDFIRAYETGKRDEAAKILERESFRDTMFRGAESKGVPHLSVATGRNGEGEIVGEKIAAGPGPADSPQRLAPSTGKANLDVSGVNLDGLKLAEASTPPASADIPRGTTAPVKSVPSLGGG